MAYYFKSFFWFLKGRKYFTREGYEENSKNFNFYDNNDVRGWNFLVTGGSSGIGKQVALEIAKLPGTNVHIVCRNITNGNAAFEYISKLAHKDSKVFIHFVDISNVKSILKFSKSFTEEIGSLNVLINNAGVLAPKLEFTEEKLEKSFATNIIGTFLLTKSLIPLLSQKKNDELKKRVIFVSSGGMLTQNLNPSIKSPNSSHFDGVSEYAQHKRQQVVICDIFAEMFPNIQFSSMHPGFILFDIGWVDTPGVENSLPGFYERYKNNLRTPEQGADTIIWLSVSGEALKYSSGTFFFDRHPAHKFLFSNQNRYDKNIENELIENIERIITPLLNENI